MILEVIAAIFIFKLSINKERKLTTYNPYNKDDTTYCIISVWITKIVRFTLIPYIATRFVLIYRLSLLNTWAHFHYTNEINYNRANEFNLH